MAGRKRAQRLRIALLIAIPLGYVGLIGYGTMTGQPAGFALADVFLGSVLIVGVLSAFRPGDTGPNLVGLARVGYLVAGVAFGYSGLVGLGVVPRVPGASVVGDLALVVALGAYVYQREFGEPTG